MPSIRNVTMIGVLAPRSGESGSTLTSRIGAAASGAITSAAPRGGSSRVKRKYAIGIIGAPTRASASVTSCVTIGTALRLGKPP